MLWNFEIVIVTYSFQALGVYHTPDANLSLVVYNKTLLVAWNSVKDFGISKLSKGAMWLTRSEGLK